MINQKANKKVTFLLVRLDGAGGERVIVDLANSFTERGIEVDMVLMQEKGVLLNSLNKKVNLVNLNTKTFLQTIFKLSTYLRKNKIDAMISISPHTHIVSFFAKMLTFSFKTRLIFRVGIPYTKIFKQSVGIKEKLIPVFIKIIYPFSYKVIAVSKGIADDVRKVVWLKKDKIKVIYNLKNLTEIIESAGQVPDHAWFQKHNNPIILSVGRLREQKDFETLIRSFVIVRKSVDARLVILGEGSERIKLEKIVKELDLEEFVYMPGFSTQVYSFMKYADVFVSTSLWEGMPNAVIESLVVGTPVIATDCPYGTREVLAPDTDYKTVLKDGIEYAKYGVLVPVGSKKDISKVIIEMLNNPQIVVKYKQKSLERSEFFKKENIFKQYISVTYHS